MSAPNPQPPAPAVNLDKSPQKSIFNTLNGIGQTSLLPALQGIMEGIAHSRRDALFSFRVDTKTERGTRDAKML